MFYKKATNLYQKAAIVMRQLFDRVVRELPVVQLVDGTVAMVMKDLAVDLVDLYYSNRYHLHCHHH